MAKAKAELGWVPKSTRVTGIADCLSILEGCKPVMGRGVGRALS